MRDTVQPADLSFFSTLAASGSLSAAARELGLTAAAVSKHLTQMESRAGVALVNRTTRRMMLTPEGELYLAHARRILDEIDELAELLGNGEEEPERIAARQCDARVRAQPRRACDLPVCRAIPASVGSASVVGHAAAAHATMHSTSAFDSASRPIRAWSPGVLRRIGGCCARRLRMLRRAGCHCLRTI